MYYQYALTPEGFTLLIKTGSGLAHIRYVKSANVVEPYLSDD
jgi:hypothetical protein